ncbi:MAG: alginate lyase family protein [Magnetococcales bacterium]|nr:alginate lyase family protein [Magnetococcales bacterium]
MTVCRRLFARLLLTTLISLTASPLLAAGKGIWISPADIARLPTTGKAWQALKKAADSRLPTPNLSDQEDMANVQVMAKALVYARLGEERYRQEVIQACLDAIGTEVGGRTLALGRELIAYVIAADLVGLPPEADQRFRSWIKASLDLDLEGQTLRKTHEKRPNNWGTHAGASRLAVAVYLDDKQELEKAARVFKGWVGDRKAYNRFKFRALTWHPDPANPVAINPKGSTIQGHSVDGLLADEQRRCCNKQFRWPPPHENYVYEGLQGAMAQAVILHQAGYSDVWQWQDQALLRAFKWLHDVAKYPAKGDDIWQIHLINHYYGPQFPAETPAKPGKNVGWTDWTHGQQVPNPG